MPFFMNRLRLYVFKKKDFRGKVPFQLHLLKGTYYQNDLSLLMLNHLAKVFVRIRPYSFSFLPPFVRSFLPSFLPSFHLSFSFSSFSLFTLYNPYVKNENYVPMEYLHKIFIILHQKFDLSQILLYCSNCLSLGQGSLLELESSFSRSFDIPSLI